MQDILLGIKQACYLLFTFDYETYNTILLSLKVSGIAVFFSSLIGISFGTFFSMKHFPNKKFIMYLINTCMGLPPVVIGLVVYLFLSSSGPLGSLELLFTAKAMIIAQTILVTPIIAGLTIAALNSVDPMIALNAKTLGADKFQVGLTILNEARYGVIAAVISGFGRAIAEVGAVIMVGGDIAGSTRVMTTAIALQTRMGQFDTALALGIILILISFLINLFIFRLADRR
ncbi:MAG: ABC transporter permease [bacterium]